MEMGFYRILIIVGWFFSPVAALPAGSNCSVFFSAFKSYSKIRKLEQKAEASKGRENSEGAVNLEEVLASTREEFKAFRASSELSLWEKNTLNSVGKSKLKISDKEAIHFLRENFAEEAKGWSPAEWQ